MKGITKNALSINTRSDQANGIGSYRSSDVLQKSAPGKVSQEQSVADNNISYGEALLNSERTVTLKDNRKGELSINKITLQYTNYIKEWLEGCLSYRFIGERIGKQISKNDQMLNNPAPAVISSVEAVMHLIENNIPLGCLDNTTLDKLSKDQVVIDLVGRICNNLAISEEERDEVVTKCCEYYDNIEFEIR